MIKDADGIYPTRDGQRSWWKYRSKASLDMLAAGFTGTTVAPTALVLASPVVDEDGQPVTAESTTVLCKAAARPIVPLLRPTRDLERTRRGCWCGGRRGP